MSESSCQAEEWEEDTEKLLASLEGWGADTWEAMERFLDDEQMYRRSLIRFATDGSLETLMSRLKEGRLEEAFEVVHSMKGTILILSLTPMKGIILRVTEPLREGEAPSEADIERLKRAFGEYRQLLKKQPPDGPTE